MENSFAELIKQRFAEGADENIVAQELTAALNQVVKDQNAAEQDYRDALEELSRAWNKAILYHIAYRYPNDNTIHAADYYYNAEECNCLIISNITVIDILNQVAGGNNIR